MRDVLFVTAGHVDHGKTALVRALTGVDTDRWDEEKRRGLTIDIGFASMKARDGSTLGIVDVPGHEKFIKNMLAGVGGIDAALLLVALDEGIKPQTIEHFRILSTIGMQQGIVVLTKSDRVDEAQEAAVRREVDALLTGSFLAEAPRIAVSAKSGDGIDALRQAMLQMAQRAPERDMRAGQLRMPVDRVFTVQGFGTVVTGTLWSGSCRVGDDIMLYPQGRRVRIRGIQHHNEDATEAVAGQRTALNLPGVRREEIRRGSILAAVDALHPVREVEADIAVLPDADVSLRHRSRVHVHFAAGQMLATVLTPDKRDIPPGGRGRILLRFVEPAVFWDGEPLILRFFSPVRTFAGGTFHMPSLENEAPAAARSFSGDAFAAEHTARAEAAASGVGEPSEVAGARAEAAAFDARVLQAYAAAGMMAGPTADVAERLSAEISDVNAAVLRLAAQGRLVKLAPGLYLTPAAREDLHQVAARLLENPQGFTVSTFRQELQTSRKLALPLLDYLDRRGYTKRKGDWRVPGTRPLK